MRALFVTSTFPEDILVANSGIHQRMKLFLEALSGISELDVLFYVNSGIDISRNIATAMERNLEERWNCKAKVFLCRKSSNDQRIFSNRGPISSRLKNWWILHPLYYGARGQEQLAAFQECLERKPEAVFVHRLNSIHPVLASRKPLPPVYFDLDDVEHRAYIRGLQQPPHWRSKFIQYFKVPSLLWLERRAFSRARKTFICSAEDKKYLEKKFRCGNFVVVPNAIEIPAWHAAPEKPTFLFVGTFQYAPNVVAAEILVKKIWPLIKLATPEALLVIAGKNPENVSASHEPQAGVEFRGFVRDLDTLYRDTRVVCCPIQSGSGTRIKIIEAAAHGKAIVSTTLGAEGLDFVDGSEIILHDDHEAFARACIELIKDGPWCEAIGKAAHEKAKMSYGRKNAIAKVQFEVVQGC